MRQFEVLQEHCSYSTAFPLQNWLRKREVREFLLSFLFSVPLSITCSGFFLLAAFAGGGGGCCCGCCCSWWFLCVFQMQYFSRKTAVIGWLHYLHFPFCNLDCHNLVLLLCWNKAAEINARVCVCVTVYLFLACSVMKPHSSAGSCPRSWSILEKSWVSWVTLASC